MLKAGLIGFGGIAQSHRRAYERLEKEGKIKLVCAFDIREEAYTKRVKINLDSGEESCLKDIRFYTDLEEMLQKEELDLVDIAVPTYLHKEYAVKMLERGYNVMSEKPMSLYYSDCKEMLEAAEKTDKHYMVGQCLRFYPQYSYLKKCIDSKIFGNPISAFFSRISNPPVWGYQNWYMDYNKSGGAMTDLHIHDVDVVRYLFGEPEKVSCYANNTLTKYDSCRTTFVYSNIDVLAVADWTLVGYKFSHSYRVCFEKAAVVFENNKVTVYPNGSQPPYVVDLPDTDGITGELSYYSDVLAGKIENTVNPPESAAKTIKLIEKMRESADNNGKLLDL